MMSDNERERDPVEEQEPVPEENRKEFENALPGSFQGRSADRDSVGLRRWKQWDVARLAEYCWKGVAEAVGSRATRARETVAALTAHPWPASVRELQNMLVNLTVTGPRYGRVGPGALPAAFRPPPPSGSRPSPRPARTWSA